MKKPIIILYVFGILSGTFLLGFGVQKIIDLFYFWGVNKNPNTNFYAHDLLVFYGSIISFLGSALLGAIAILGNYYTHRENFKYRFMTEIDGPIIDSEAMIPVIYSENQDTITHTIYLGFNIYRYEKNNYCYIDNKEIIELINRNIPFLTNNQNTIKNPKNDRYYLGSLILFYNYNKIFPRYSYIEEFTFGYYPTPELEPTKVKFYFPDKSKIKNHYINKKKFMQNITLLFEPNDPIIESIAKEENTNIIIWTRVVFITVNNVKTKYDIKIILKRISGKYIQKKISQTDLYEIK